MTLNPKTLGLALVAVFALSALAASVASAQNQGTLTSDGPVTLTSTETGEDPTLANGKYDNRLTTVFGTFGCSNGIYTGHTVLTHEQTTTGDKHGQLPSGSTTFTVTHHGAAICIAHIPVLGTRPMTMTMNGCDYVFHIGQTTGGSNTYGVTTDIICPPGKNIETHVYKNGSVGHPDVDTICTVKFGSESGGVPVNQGLTGPHLTNTPASDDFALSGTWENMHTEVSGPLCSPSTSKTVNIDVDLTFKGHNAAGENTGVTITDP